MAYVEKCRSEAMAKYMKFFFEQCDGTWHLIAVDGDDFAVRLGLA
jgi:hypothetical protein